MKNILILLLTTVLLTSCFSKDVEEAAEDIVSNVVEITQEATPEEAVEPTEEVESESEQEELQEISEDIEAIQQLAEPIVSGSDNDPRVQNTQGEGTNPPETQTPSVPTAPVSDSQTEEVIREFETGIDGLFDLIDSDEG